MESITARKIIVTKLVERIRAEYNEFVKDLYIQLKSHLLGLEGFDDEHSQSKYSYTDSIARELTTANWIKTNILDGDGKFFYQFYELEESADSAIYFISSDILMCWLESDFNWVRLFVHTFYDYIYILDTLDPLTLENILCSPIRMVGWRRNHPEWDSCNPNPFHDTM